MARNRICGYYILYHQKLHGQGEKVMPRKVSMPSASLAVYLPE